MKYRVTHQNCKNLLTILSAVAAQAGWWNIQNESQLEFLAILMGHLVANDLTETIFYHYDFLTCL